MIKEQLGSALSPTNIRNKTMELAVTDSALQGTNTGDAVRAAMDMTRDLGEENIIKRPIKKSNIKKLVGKTKMKLPIGKIFTMSKISENKLFDISKKEMDELINEKWSQKYKDSIDCKNPKGFSQRAHCQGKKKKVSEEKLQGGKADNKTFEDLVKKNLKNNKSYDDIESMLKKQLNKGVKVEMEHTNDKKRANEIAMDHLFEDPKYYDKLEKIESKESTGSGSDGGFVGPVGFNPKSKFVKDSFKETPKKVESNEATGSGSAGSYVTPAAWAKTMNKGDWRGKSKTQIPGGQFVQVKKKCKKFPYCNQGDIKALNLSETIKKISLKYGISENVVRDILKLEFGNNSTNKQK